MWRFTRKYCEKFEIRHFNHEGWEFDNIKNKKKPFTARLIVWQVFLPLFAHFSLKWACESFDPHCFFSRLSTWKKIHFFFLQNFGNFLVHEILSNFYQNFVIFPQGKWPYSEKKCNSDQKNPKNIRDGIITKFETFQQ